MAYRTARETMLSHEAAIDAAEAVYFEAHPEAAVFQFEVQQRLNKYRALPRLLSA
jgi:hypothetical protein